MGVSFIAYFGFRGCKSATNYI